MIQPLQIVKKSYIIEWWEKFELPELERYADNQIMQESPVIDLDIKHQTSDYLVLYKPKWVLSHPRTLFDVKEPSVSGFLFHKFGHLPAASGFIRWWIIHRLDKDTDGLMIVALSEKGLKYFRELFDSKGERLLKVEESGEKWRKVKEGRGKLRKYYTAFCEITKKGERRLEINKQFPVVIDSLIYPKTNTIGYPKRGVTIVKQVLPNSKALANTSYNEGWNAILVELEIITWRTHQIRFQLAEIGLPIVWDGLYGSSYGILWLTAYKLEFVDPDGKEVVVEI